MDPGLRRQYRLSVYLLEGEKCTQYTLGEGLLPSPHALEQSSFFTKEVSRSHFCELFLKLLRLPDAPKNFDFSSLIPLGIPA